MMRLPPPPWLALLLALAAPVAARDLPAAPTGRLADQAATATSPLAAEAEVLSRLLPPTTADRMRRYLRSRGGRLSQTAIDLAAERFDLYVPAQPPASGYGVLVFVAPMDVFEAPRDWWPELDRRGLVYIAARRSGNDQDVLDRRIPLALHALEHVRHRYPVDPSRLFVGGFSGGAMVAQRILLTHADVFAGALMFAGSRTLGERGYFPPTPERLRLLQENRRLVLATGVKDFANRANDARTAQAMRDYCLAGVSVITLPRLEHWVPDRRGFARAADEIERPLAPDRAAQDACRAGLAGKAQAALAAVRAAAGRGDTVAAGTLLADADFRYGGLVGDELVALSRQLGGE